MKKIKITCEGSDIANINDLINLQGDLKGLSKENMRKLKGSIIKYGFTTPVFVWGDKNRKYILDGVQRLKALKQLLKEGYEIDYIPIVNIKAKNKKEAKEKLLHIASQYGVYKRNGIQKFIIDEIDIDSISNTVEIPYLELFAEKAEYVEESITPYNFVHILISIPLGKYHKYSQVIDKLKSDKNIEVEISGN